MSLYMHANSEQIGIAVGDDIFKIDLGLHEDCGQMVSLSAFALPVFEARNSRPPKMFGIGCEQKLSRKFRISGSTKNPMRKTVSFRSISVDCAKSHARQARVSR